VELRALDAQGIKAHLPIVYVLDRYNIPVEDGGDGRWAAVCPFHDDADPSLDVYGERLERWGCFPCGAKGDVFDLIQRLAWPEGTPAFRDVRAYALTLLSEMEASDWSGPTQGVGRSFDSARARAVVAQSRVADLSAVRRFLAHKHAQGELRGIDDAVWLGSVWGVGTRGDEVVIPYWDRTGNLVSYKHRTALTKALSPPGRGQFANVLYGEWLDADRALPVVLCEGETDAWAASAALSNRSRAVLAIPTGSGAHPVQAWTLAGREVLVAFDGDDAGWAGTCLWLEALGNYAADVSFVRPPDGCDLSDLPPDELVDLLIG
jgi:hypothetical protein